MKVKECVKKSGLIMNCYTKALELCTVISPVLNTKLLYRITFNRCLNLNAPETFNEKILWLKLNCYMKHPLVIQCADKYRVREYVEKCGLSNILIDLLGVYESVDDINWESFPNKFAMKMNFGSGFNIICTDKSKLSKDECMDTLRAWIKEKYWLKHSEMQYKYAPKRIICEKLLSADNSESFEWIAPYDYKVFCFNGVAKLIRVGIGREKGTLSFYHFDRNWVYTAIKKNSPRAPDDVVLHKPKLFDEMIYVAEKLAEPFPFVRCDLYVLDDKVYFGELTFTPHGGIDSSLLSEKDLMMGQMIDLDYGIGAQGH